ncbi:MAG: cytochrome b N-terminal domain-containing protein, partial [Burkholderiaceae bacterium]|nr:cytochrome b N-terminal domain-containing protein [Burkholderiaceae bacterium]
MMDTPSISPKDPASGHAPGPSVRAWRALERGADRLCGAGDNPLRQLGALGFLLFWLIAASGIYLYIFFDTDLDGAHASVERLTHGQWWAGGVMRSLHRYASDAFVVVIGLHLMRELMLGRFYGFRWVSWVSGIPTIWLAGASGVIGYWLVWDELAQFIGIAVTEWFGALPGFGPAVVRNFIADSAMTDRMFSLLVFLHIGVPLALLLAMWAHIQRLTQAATMTTRALTGWTIASLLALSLAWPALSQAPANLARVPSRVQIDWFYLAPFPAIYEASSLVVWAVVLGATLLLAAAPWLVRVPRPPAAKVDPDHCNGCTRCFADCPYAAIVMAPHPSGRGQIAVVSDDLCASCGICAGACPTSTPFRSADRLVTGIDLPSRPVDALRAELALKLGAA